MRSALHSLAARIRSLVRAIQAGDEAQIEQAILRLSRRRRVFAPLGFAVGAFVLLFDGLRLIVTNWRMMLVQILPAMWIWLAMFDLKLHVLHGKSLNVLRGPILIPLGSLVVALTVASFFLNAVFAFAVAQAGRPQVRPAFAEARRHLSAIVGSGAIVGLALAFATLVVPRWGRPWFGLVLSVVVGRMPRQALLLRRSSGAVPRLVGACQSRPPTAATSHGARGSALSERGSPGGAVAWRSVRSLSRWDGSCPGSRTGRSGPSGCSGSGTACCR